MGSIEQPTFDFIVVGAGNAGAVTARNLANSASRPSVLLIEAGGQNKNKEFYIPSNRFVSPYKYPETAKNYHTTPQSHLNGRVLDYLRGIGLGGSSIANFLGYIRGSQADANLMGELVGDDSWKWPEILQGFKELENLHFDEGAEDDFVRPVKEAHGYSGPLDISLPSRRQWPKGMDKIAEAARSFGYPINPDQNSGELVGVGVVSTTTHAGYRTTSATAYLKDPPSNLVIWTDSVVTKVLLDTSTSSGDGKGPRATGVLLKDGREVRAAKETILSLGTIDTPKLLMLSGIGPEEDLRALGIPCHVNSPKVGKGLIDHPYLIMRHRMSSNFSDFAAYEKDTENVKAARQQWLHDGSGPDGTHKTRNIIGFLKFDPERYSGAERDALDARTRAFLDEPSTPHYEVFWTPNAHPSVDGEILTTAVMLMNPQARGTVTLASADPDADPVIDPKYLSHPYDRRTFVDAVRESLRFVAEGDLKEYVLGPLTAPKSRSEEDVLAFLQQDVESILHPVGTVVMGGPDDKDACVDSSLRFRGVQGLRIVDLSVCPRIPCNHTQSTAYIVGHVGWKKIAADHNL